MNHHFKQLLALSVAVGSALCVLASGYPNLIRFTLQPTDTPQAHALQSKVDAEYILFSISYDQWTNGLGPSYYDDQAALASNNVSKFLFKFDQDLPTNAISSFVPEILARYPFAWAVIPINEETNVGVASDTIKIYRNVLATNILLGPSVQNTYSPAYMDALAASNALQLLDGIDMHDYFACPGNGGLPTNGPPWTTNYYVHPQDTPTNYVGYPNLQGRIDWMRTYTNQLRTNWPAIPKVWVAEYGLYIFDTNDAVTAAAIFRDNQVPVFVWLSCGYPSCVTNVAPYSPVLYDENPPYAGYYSPPLDAFLRNHRREHNYGTVRFGR
jgi:hypothetical protein